MSCGSSNQEENYQNMSQITKFSEKQIRIIHNFFRQFSKDNNKDFLELDEFKKCFGIVGKDNDFIIQRLMICINEDKKTKKVSFINYLKFLDLVNNGNNEDKNNICFRFFDLKGNGVIYREEFVEVIYEICKFLSRVTNNKIKINKEEIGLLFNRVLERLGTKHKHLTKQEFHYMIQNQFEEFDIYNIFHNILRESNKVKIEKKKIFEVFEVESKLNELINKVANPFKTKKLSLSFFSSILSLIKRKVNIAKSKNKTSILETLNKQNTLESVKNSNLYNRSKYSNTVIKREIKFNEKENSPDDLKENDNIRSSLNNKFLNGFTKKISNLIIPNFKKEIFNNINDINEEVDDNEYMSDQNSLNELENEESDEEDNLDDLNSKDFQFISLKKIKVLNELQNQLEKYGLDYNNMLIINNIKSFEEFLNEILNSIKVVTNELKQYKLGKKRRQGISINLQTESDLNYDDFFNYYSGANSDEKGLIHLGSDNIDMVLNMMVGIKSSIKTVNEDYNNFNRLYLTNNDIYKEIQSYRFTIMNNAPDLNSETSDNDACLFYDYAPKIFDNLRKMYGISNEDYMKSLGPENFIGSILFTKNRSLKELVSSGKSGSFFYFSYDSKYLLKTIPEKEFSFFLNLLPKYYNHIENNIETLLQRFYGLHKMEYKGLKMFFVVMNNCFNTNVRIDYKYDLKGSSYQRLSRNEKDKDYDNYDFSIPLKDNDLRDRKEKFEINNLEFNLLKNQVIADVNFLAENNINDYSLLIGVHDSESNNGKKSNVKDKIILETKTVFESENEKFGRQPFFEVHHGGLLSKDSKKTFFIGIIDLFTEYGGKKKFEHAFKSVFQGSGISCQPPEDYAKRFLTFFDEIIKS